MGEPIGAEELYRAHAPYVAAFLGRMGARRQDMQDAVQEVFLVAHQRGGFVPGAARPTTWLCEIALRVWWSARRRDGRRSAEIASADAGVDALSDVPGADDQLEAASAAQRVQRCLEGLDEEHRAVLVLFELQDESTDDIASILGIPLGTVHSRLHHARKKFRARWERSHGRGAP